MDIHQIRSRVLSNCDITDAKYAGIYSVCGLVMRLRDLYKWEKGLAPWQEDDPARVLEWIGDKETQWEGLMESDYHLLPVNGHSVDAFNAVAVNESLHAKGLYYGAGYAHSLKPTFFLAEIDDCITVEEHKVWILGKELARDLLTLPAFSQDGQVVLRTEAGRMYLWDQILYMGNSGRRALDYALITCGLPDQEHATIQRYFGRIWRVQKTIYIRHEVGELHETVFDRQIWQQMLADYPHTAVEHFIRTLKDLLADTGPRGALTHLIEKRNRAGLGLYMAFGNGMIRMLTRTLVCAFDAFAEEGGWGRLAEASHSVREEVIAHTRRVVEIYDDFRSRRDLKQGQDAIEKLMHQAGLIRK